MNSLKITTSLWAVAFLLIATSCNKPDNGKPFTTEPVYSKILFVNVLSESDPDSISFFMDEINVTPVAVAFASPSKHYIELVARTHDFAVKTGDNFILQENIKIEEGKLYTLYLSGTRAFPVFKLLEDFVTVDEGKAGCSFVHMAPMLEYVKLENNYPAEPYFGWADTDTLIVRLLEGQAIGRPYYASSKRMQELHAEELADILVRASNPKGTVAYTVNNDVRMPLEINKYGNLVLYPDSSQSTGYNLFSYSISDRL
jgi:hypothetical protein